MKIDVALPIAQSILEQLAPHCFKCEIAGSIRRMCDEVKDIDIVAIPKPFDIGLLKKGIAEVTEELEFVKGKYLVGKKLDGRNIQRRLKEGIVLDLYLANENNFGSILAQRTGSPNFAIRLKKQAKQLGYSHRDGLMWYNNKLVPIPDEETLFRLLKIKSIPPAQR